MEKQIRNEESKENIFLNLFFLKSFRLYIRGRQKNIQVEELCRLWPYHNSKKLGEFLETRWNCLKNKNDKVSITQVLWNCFGKTFLLFGLFQATFQITVILFAQPFLVGKIVSYFTPQQTELSKHGALCYVYILIFVLTVKALYGSNYTLLMARFGIQIRTALCSFLFRKILKLSSTHLDDLSTGKVLTLITKDVQSLENFAVIGNYLWVCLLKVLIICCILYVKVGLSCFVGIGCFLLVMPLQIYLGGKVKKMKINMSRESDQRLQTLQETISGIRLIKMYSLENFFADKIHTCRKKEMTAALKMFIVRFVILTMGTLNSELALYLTLMTFIAVGNNISGEIIYFIALVSRQLIYLFGTEFPDVIYRASEALAAVRRLNVSLRKMEVVPSTEKNTIKTPSVNATNVTLSLQKKTVLTNVTINLRTGLTVISGPVGSGKSIFLKTLLNEYSPDEGSLAVEGSLSYASQEPWLFPGSIKKNILFGEEYDVKRYQEVLRVCALVYDLEVLRNSDETIVEDRGANLSKGQQARISLARAVYRQRDIYLLDAPFAGLDTHVATYVFEECVKKFLMNKIVVLVTHSLNFSKEATDLVSFENGTVSISPTNLKVEDSSTKEKKKKVNDHSEGAEEESNETTTLVVKEKIFYEEQSKSGAVNFATYQNYAVFGGGVLALMFVFLSQGGVVLVLNFKDVFVSNWVNSEEILVVSPNSTETEIRDEHMKVFQIYSSLMVLLLTIAVLRSVAVLLFARRASIRIHKQMIGQITRASVAFFDNNCIGNIMNRFSTDLTTVDEILPFLLARGFKAMCLLVGSTLVVALVNKQFLIPTAALFTLMVLCRRYTIKTSTSLKRLDTISKSPVVGHISATLSGLTTIRALKAEETVKNDFDRHQNVYASTSCAFQSTSKAFIFVLDSLAALFNTIIITRFFATEMTPGDVGLAISNAFLITGALHLTVSAWTELENQMTSTERTLEYTQIKEENSGGVEIENWPNNGEIIFEKVSLTYDTHKSVLHNVNLRIESGEKIGVVGRTGAGKTSLISSLFRMYDIEGKIIIDGVDIKTVSPTFLRSHISIIPQEPFVFSATIRENIDPLQQFSDEEIWKAVEKVGLMKHISSLDLQIGTQSVNLSVGQKQLLCIARAILQKNKIVVLDEITACTDAETEKTIHQAIEENFSSCTIITIAHKLQTVLRSDRIVVLDRGAVVECDAPAVLMTDESSLFCKMIAKGGLSINRNK